MTTKRPNQVQTATPAEAWARLCCPNTHVADEGASFAAIPSKSVLRFVFRAAKEAA